MNEAAKTELKRLRTSRVVLWTSLYCTSSGLNWTPQTLVLSMCTQLYHQLMFSNIRIFPLRVP